MFGLREESHQNWDLFMIRFAKNLCGYEVVGNEINQLLDTCSASEIKLGD